jgi:hypothetical protein
LREHVQSKNLTDNGANVVDTDGLHADIRKSNRHRCRSIQRQAASGLFSNVTHAAETQMNRVTGIGGIFFTAQDPVALRSWYLQPVEEV